MAIDAIVKFSQQSNPPTYQAINSALVGHPQNGTGPGPFTRVGTSAYSCMSFPNDQVVLNALAAAIAAAAANGAYMDSMQISFVRHNPPATAPEVAE